MNNLQRNIAFDLAQQRYTFGRANVALDANAKTGEGFDEVEDGVWIRAWVKVPAKDIPGYSMEPAAPPSVVETVRTPPITD